MLATKTDKEVAVIDYFLKHNNNTVPVIAAALGLNQSTVSKILDNYLSDKTIKNV